MTVFVVSMFMNSNIKRTRPMIMIRIKKYTNTVSRKPNVGYTLLSTLGFESHSWRGVLDITLCDKVCQWLAAGGWFSPGTPVSATNKTDRHDITELLLKVALNTITITSNHRRLGSLHN